MNSSEFEFEFAKLGTNYKTKNVDKFNRDLIKRRIDVSFLRDTILSKKEKRMITFNQIKQLLAFETQGKYCVEILFSVDGSTKFDCCWMGKLFDKAAAKDVYWFGLTADGKNAFDYSTFEDFSSAKVFDGKSLVEIWNTVIVEEIDGFEPLERLENYIGEIK